MTTIINASPSNGLVQTADGSGVLKVQSNGVTTNALAWCRFNGTPTIAAQYNISSITLISTGYYSVSFTTALTDANYSILMTNSDNPTLARVFAQDSGTAPTVNGFRFYSFSSSSNALTSAGSYSSFAIFGN
jgi:hypothetical protein